MGFNKIYNWIRHSKLPPSYLFKNRLVSDKDNRPKNIFNDQSSTFRSNLWSKLNKKNTQLFELYSFNKLLTNTLYLLLVLSVFYITFGITPVEFVNSMVFLVWRSADIFWSLYANIATLLFGFFQLFSKILPKIFYPNFKTNEVSSKKKLNINKEPVNQSDFKNYLYEENNFLLIENLFKTTKKKNIEDDVAVLKKYYQTSEALQGLSKVVAKVNKQTTEGVMSSNEDRWSFSEFLKKKDNSFNLVFNKNDGLVLKDFNESLEVKLSKKLAYRWAYKYSINSSAYLKFLDNLSSKDLTTNNSTSLPLGDTQSYLNKNSYLGDSYNWLSLKSKNLYQNNWNSLDSKKKIKLNREVAVNKESFNNINKGYLLLEKCYKEDFDTKLVSNLPAKGVDRSLEFFDILDLYVINNIFSNTVNGNTFYKFKLTNYKTLIDFRSEEVSLSKVRWLNSLNINIK